VGIQPQIDASVLADVVAHAEGLIVGQDATGAHHTNTVM